MSNTPSLAERARSLLHSERVGSLATQSKRVAGFPFASLVAYGLDSASRPILLLSALAVHAQNLSSDRRASLLVSEAEQAEEPLARTRVTVLGEVTQVPAGEVDELREAYLERHPAAQEWVRFGDFSFHRLEPSEIYCVAGFGDMGWVARSDYDAAEIDPLVGSAGGILSHMNADHGDALVLYCRAFADLGVEEATMTGIDRFGFRVRGGGASDGKTVRIEFPREIRTTNDARMVLIEMLRDARTRLGVEVPPPKPH